MTTTIETRIVRTASGMEFDVSVAGDPGRPLVLMLHDFCVSRHYWESQTLHLPRPPIARPPLISAATHAVHGRTNHSMPTT